MIIIQPGVKTANAPLVAGFLDRAHQLSGNLAPSSSGLEALRDLPDFGGG